MNTLIQESHNHSESCIRVKKFRRTQNVDFHLANEGQGVGFFIMDLGHNFGSKVGNEFGDMLRGKQPHESNIAYNIVRVHSLMIYTELIGYNNVADTNTPLLRCFLFFRSSRMTTGQYMNYQTFSNMQIGTQLINPFRSSHVNMGDTSREKLPIVSVGVTSLVLIFLKASNTHF